MTLSVGDTFAGYRIVAVLHVTPSDAVYLVAHPTAPADEILRVYSPSVEVDVYTDDRIYGEFRQEMSAAEYLLVDGLAAIHRVGRTDGRTWMTSAAAQGSRRERCWPNAVRCPSQTWSGSRRRLPSHSTRCIGTRSFTATSGHTASIWTIARTHHGQHLPASTIHVACRHPPPM